MTSVHEIEPLFPEVGPQDLDDLAVELVAKASALAARLHPVLRASIGDLVRSMNCYYSNLIEGHDTLPADIDRALAGNYSREPGRRQLQLEARAHIEVQRLVDAGEVPAPVVSVEFIRWLHQAFCERLPDELLWVESPDTGERQRVVGGELRKRHVRVGAHIPPAPEELGAFLLRFVEAYSPPGLSRSRKVVAAAASHHRLLWIHPFLDGNGRVARLFSHAFLREIGVGSELWSVSRGLARSAIDYKARLMAADGPRRGDLDGRGSLTQAGLVEFCRYFLETCVDQVTFMESLLEPSELLRRIEIWCEEETRARRLPKNAWPLLREAVLAGGFPRGRAPDITGYRARQARTVVKALTGRGYLTSSSARGPVRLGIPIHVVDRWFPRLYPGAVGS